MNIEDISRKLQKNGAKPSRSCEGRENDYSRNDDKLLGHNKILLKKIY